MSALLMPVVALAAIAVGAELAARRWIRFGRAYYVFPPGMRLQLHVDREAFPELEPVVRFDVNADGERGADVPRLRAGESLYRILIVGGSQPEGYLLDQETAWPLALGRMLSAPDALSTLGVTRVHAGSIARSGVGSEALNLLLERVLPRYARLATIVILVGASDMLRWLEQGAPADVSSDVRTDEVFRCHPEGPFGWTPSSLAIVELARRWWRRHLRPVQIHERAGRWIERARAMRAQARVVRATVPDASPMLAHFEHHFRQVVGRARAHADRVIVVRQSWFDKSVLSPEEAAHMWHGGAGQAWCEEVTTYYSHDVTCRLMAMLDESASQIARDLDVEQIDLMPLLDASLDTYYDCFHLTPSGSRKVAAAVASTLLRQPVQSEFVPCVDLRAS